MYCHAKSFAKKNSLPFNLDLSDIVVPEFCPVFDSVRLNKTRTKTGDDSPSLDRLVPKLGYVKGNINVISYRANRIKNDASLQDLSKVMTWLSIKLEEKGAENARS
jgi:hypothetical protein